VSRTRSAASATAILTVICLGGVLLLSCGAGTSVAASNQEPPPQLGQLSLGTVSSVTPVRTCPTGFYPGMACFTATVSCPATDDIGVTFGYATPPGVLQGTIFLHAGSAGTGPFDYGRDGETYVNSYYQAGYRVVELEWAKSWEIATSSGSENIKMAACRPATLLRYVYDNIHGGASGEGAMCAHGNSAGSAAMAYALTWYGASSFLDKVVLTSGPVLGDIEAGCQVPNVPPVDICAPGQFGCKGEAWSSPPQYPQGGNILQTWTGDRTCNNVPPGQSTSGASNAAWLAQSVSDGTPEANYDYPKTALSGWLCSNALNCSAAQGQYYFRNFTNSSQTAAYSLNRIDGCRLAEDIWDGVTSDGISGFTASVKDMTDPLVGCVKRH
jgi:hypothetical protein